MTIIEHTKANLLINLDYLDRKIAKLPVVDNVRLGHEQSSALYKLKFLTRFEHTIN